MSRARMFAFAIVWAGATCVPTMAQAACDDPQSNQEMIHCAAEEYRLADQELNFVYGNLIARLRTFYSAEDIRSAGGQDPVRELRDAQRKWIAFRDANCRFRGTEMLGGTGQPLVVNVCLATMTRARVAELKEYLAEH